MLTPSPILVPLRRLSRDLRYRTLDELIGREIRVASLEAIGPALAEIVAPWLPHAPRRLDHDPAPALAKYGLVDATFDAPLELLDDPRTASGIKLLRMLGFAYRPEPASGPVNPEYARANREEVAGYLEDMLAEIARGGCYLKVMLNERRSSDERRGPSGADPPDEPTLPGDDWPRVLGD